MASDTRKRVLQTLLTRQRCTINDLAEAVGINPISVRHHLVKLEAEGLVTSEEERRGGVGRPRRVYSLTEKGREQFPTRYLRLTVRLLEQLKETLPEHMVRELFTQMAVEMASDAAGDLNLNDLTLEERLNVLQELLAREGFAVEWEQHGNEYFIREVSCPYYHVGQAHPEVCSVDQTLIRNLLNLPAEKVQCMLDGDAHCVYVVPKLIPTE